ncbi:MAG: hypothetical protein NZ898_08450 [Myxococcota bacterium]|nr:hypothetical protein [Myxococcota bacterium]MDW8362600.1 hypothetical protein [Myxococcales bacterium]
MNRRVACSILFLFLLFASGCAPVELGLHRHGDTGDGVQETYATALTIEEQWSAEGDWVTSPPLAATVTGATRISAMISMLAGSTMPPIEGRGLAGGHAVTDWIPLRPTFSEETLHVAIADLGEIADAAQIRLHRETLEAIASVRWSAVRLDAPADTGAERTGWDAPTDESRSALRASLRGLGIVTRAEWGARDTDCSPAEHSKYRIRRPPAGRELRSLVRRALRTPGLLRELSVLRRDMANAIGRLWGLRLRRSKWYARMRRRRERTRPVAPRAARVAARRNLAERLAHSARVWRTARCAERSASRRNRTGRWSCRTGCSGFAVA